MDRETERQEDRQTVSAKAVSFYHCMKNCEGFLY